MNTPVTHAMKFSPFFSGTPMRRIPHARDAVHRILRNCSRNSAVHHRLIQDHRVDPLQDSAVAADGLPSAKSCI